MGAVAGINVGTTDKAAERLIQAGEGHGNVSRLPCIGSDGAYRQGAER